MEHPWRIFSSTSKRRSKIMSAVATTSMKGVCIHTFGGPDVLRLEDIAVPEPAADEMLIHVHAAGVNPVDWKIREGYFREMPLPVVMGRDFSGTVESLGSEVTDFQIGDEVFGDAAAGRGTYAEYTIAKSAHVARKPPELDHITAAALPVAALTAWQALFDQAGLTAGQKVLIHAAAGGVGGLAVQFARQKGAHVIGTASARHAGYVRELGADEVIDYTTTRFDDLVRDVDVVFDTVGGDTQDRSWKVLRRGGILVSIVQPPPQEKSAAQGARGVFYRQQPRGDQLTRIAGLVVSGKVKLLVETILPLSEARKAQELSQGGHTQGKIVLRVD
jgi:NADPH:quinone reductase-like Zn-dependent oxidoreductase